MQKKKKLNDLPVDTVDVFVELVLGSIKKKKN